MAWMNQEKKAVIAAEIKKVVPKGWKYTLSVRNHSTLCMTISAAPVDLVAEAKRVIAERQAGMPDYQRHDNSGITYFDVNPYHPHFTADESLPVFQAILKAMNTGNHDRSDIMSDYFDVGFYVDISVGRWDKPFTFTA